MAFSRAFRSGVFLLLAAALILTVATACDSKETTSANTSAGAGEAITQPPTPEPPKYTLSSEIQPLTVDQIFKKQDSQGYRLDPTRIRTLIATGDIIPARATNWQMVQKNSFTYPFEATADFLKKADLTVVNLESPLVKGCRPTLEGMVFCGDQRFVEGLTYAGVDIASLANNHTDNYGEAGLSETAELLSANNIDVIGTGNDLIKDVNGLRFGFLAYNGVGPSFDKDTIKTAIATLRPKVDVLVVAMHWGKEYVAIPEVAPGISEDDPRQMGRFVIDSGADLIIGNHPHWVQGLEIYKGKLITYAHGNFIFDQMWSQETREGAVGKYTFYDDKLIDVEFTPVLIENYAQPHFLSGPEGKTILDRMETASREMAKGADR